MSFRESQIQVHGACERAAQSAEAGDGDMIVLEDYYLQSDQST